MHTGNNSPETMKAACGSQTSRLYHCGLLSLTLLLGACSTDNSPSSSLEVAAKGVYSGSLSEDAQMAVIGSINHGGSLWQLNDNQRLYDWNHQSNTQSTIIATGFSSDGSFALTADHQTMVLWQTGSGEAITFWTAPNEVMAVDLTPNGSYALLGLEDYSAVVFDVKRGGIKRRFQHQDRVRAVALSGDGRLAVTGSEDQTAALWNLETGTRLHLFQHQDEVHTVAISRNGTRVFTMAKYGEAIVWDASSGKRIASIPLSGAIQRRGKLFSSARFSADGSLLLTGDTDRQVILWQTDSMQKLASWTVPKRDPWKPTSASIIDLAFSADGSFMALASNGFIHRLRRQ